MVRRGGKVLTAAVLAAVLVVPAAPARGDDGVPGPESSADWRQVSAGVLHTCAVKTSGRLFCWGSDLFGGLGDDAAIADQELPVEVAGGATDWKQVSVHGGHSCAVKTSGRLFCWGGDANGELGDGGSDTNQPVPVEVAGGRTDWRQVSAGETHTCAVRTTDRLFCWGSDTWGPGQLGDGGANTDQGAPVEVAGHTADWTGVSAGSYHTCARKNSGRLYCWGAGGNGQLGDGAATNRNRPSQVAGGLTSWALVSAGYVHTCATRVSGRLFCWGGDSSGQLGDGGPAASKTRPVEVAGGITDWTSVSTGGGTYVGSSHTCGRTASKRLYCWGSDANGRLGNGPTSTADRGTPSRVSGTTAWVWLDAGGYHSCARDTSFRLFCWGADFGGRLGNGGTDTDEHRPVEVA